MAGSSRRTFLILDILVPSSRISSLRKTARATTTIVGYHVEVCHGTTPWPLRVEHILTTLAIDVARAIIGVRKLPI
jgi:hypothetical protein